MIVAVVVVIFVIFIYKYLTYYKKNKMGHYDVKRPNARKELLAQPEQSLWRTSVRAISLLWICLPNSGSICWASLSAVRLVGWDCDEKSYGSVLFHFTLRSSWQACWATKNGSVASLLGFYWILVCFYKDTILILCVLGILIILNIYCITTMLRKTLKY